MGELSHSLQNLLLNSVDLKSHAKPMSEKKIKLHLKYMLNLFGTSAS